MTAVSGGTGGGPATGGGGGAATTVPEGRYGRTADERIDRKLKVVGAVLGVLALGVLGWFGYDSIAGSKVSGEIIKSDIVSDTSVEVHLEVHKKADANGYCTLRSQAEDGSEVGRADFRFDQDKGRIDKVVTLRTAERATSVELVSCHKD
ncbi:DUF4307 domain-containing protein [Streptomyces silvensis]|uniref:DUF4307 domain-containing protein n=1 Tax=Streptomyces silvensis TaxID=1765722 RepID=A0A0W7WR85_9ACTN|nr:DUF4307 domain-containing protein [Streptomyces silvensis]KUF13057.1 hypothetical protein AT728_37615 [Streptomyces silvensis]